MIARLEKYKKKYNQIIKGLLFHNDFFIVLKNIPATVNKLNKKSIK